MPNGLEGTLKSGSVKIIIHPQIRGSSPDRLCEQSRAAISESLLQHGLEVQWKRDDSFLLGFWSTQCRFCSISWFWTHSMVWAARRIWGLFAKGCYNKQEFYLVLMRGYGSCSGDCRSSVLPCWWCPVIIIIIWLISSILRVSWLIFGSWEARKCDAIDSISRS